MTRIPGWFTEAQWDALAGIKQKTPPLKLGAARFEFVNHAMLVDGSITSDLTAIRAATSSRRAGTVGTADEFDAHVAQNRFLFIVDAGLVPHTYFQCVTPANTDIEYLNDADDPNFAARSAARQSLAVARDARIAAKGGV